VRRVALTIALVPLCWVPLGPRVASAQVAGADEDIQDNSFTVWVVGVQGGGVGRPPGTSQCSPWSPVSGTLGEQTPVFEMVQGGVTFRLFGRLCEGVAQTAWVPDRDAVDVARLLRDEVRRQIVEPVVHLAPVGAWQVVNFETHLWVEPQVDVVAQGFIPGVTVTAEATPVSMRWQPDVGGVIKYPDERVRDNTVVCDVWGAPPRRNAAPVGDAVCGVDAGVVWGDDG
jgi:hypothetical protein